MIEERRFDNPEVLADALAESVAGSLRNDLSLAPEVTLVVSGGSTPRPFFERLRERELDWPRVRVTLADERRVPVDHPESNERLVRETLMVGRASRASFIGLESSDADAQVAQAECDRRVTALRPFSVVVLGMGRDGHTASIFPGDAQALSVDDGHSCVVVAPTETRRERISLTLAALLDSRRIILHFTGQEKWRTYRSARSPGLDGELPIRAVLRAAPREVEIYWAP